ncbi:YitT family protein [Furfurilactobacillus sp. WILCCON 0119]|uniref:YitT family protein n=1 Tax=Furfurilactobacillus entadae TaxID=2922307 RepID=UPI0035EC8770
MNDLQQLIERHQYTGRLGTAFIYSICVSIALNFFWNPGHIYSSGITGAAQLTHTLSSRYLGVNLGIGELLFLLNVPLFVLAWLKISHRFTVFTVIAVGLSTVMIKVLHPVTLTTDPIVCAIFGGAVNGFGTGLALRYGISTGGLDILGIVIRRATGRKIGQINMMFNAFIVVAAGFVFGWPYAFYSAIGIFVNARVMDMVYTRQQRLQVMIITDRPKTVVDSVQHHIRRGITIVHGAEGAYKHDEKAILFTVISGYEVGELQEAINESDPGSFVSLSNITRILGNFYEPRL